MKFCNPLPELPDKHKHCPSHAFAFRSRALDIDFRAEKGYISIYPYEDDTDGKLPQKAKTSLRPLVSEELFADNTEVVWAVHHMCDGSTPIAIQSNLWHMLFSAAVSEERKLSLILLGTLHRSNMPVFEAEDETVIQQTIVPIEHMSLLQRKATRFQYRSSVSYFRVLSSWDPHTIPPNSIRGVVFNTDGPPSVPQIDEESHVKMKQLLRAVPQHSTLSLDMTNPGVYVTLQHFLVHPYLLYS
ncbi:hypothetical protein LTR37_017213 [Vermiconidia calcicola]|uniref:Uncharacterized protein n=1 Tax=Vermiconidia calcicola TaxID=1690605 RepID=A0ACC3MM62_9PEZI|nr:hypothetical protein LTR37_017213 [Vermiconidia calcicola]